MKIKSVAVSGEKNVLCVSVLCLYFCGYSFESSLIAFSMSLLFFVAYARASTCKSTFVHIFNLVSGAKFGGVQYWSCCKENTPCKFLSFLSLVELTRWFCCYWFWRCWRGNCCGGGNCSRGGCRDARFPLGCYCWSFLGRKLLTGRFL